MVRCGRGALQRYLNSTLDTSVRSKRTRERSAWTPVLHRRSMCVHADGRPAPCAAEPEVATTPLPFSGVRALENGPATGPRLRSSLRPSSDIDPRGLLAVVGNARFSCFICTIFASPLDYEPRNGCCICSGINNRFTTSEVFPRN